MDTVFKDYFALDKFNNAKMPYVLMVFSGKYLGSHEKYFVNPVFKGEEKEEKRKKKSFSERPQNLLGRQVNRINGSAKTGLD